MNKQIETKASLKNFVARDNNEALKTLCKHMRQHLKYPTVGLLIFLFSCNQTLKQDDSTVKRSEAQEVDKNQPKRESFKREIKNLPSDLTKFIPDNYSVLDTASGDLNLDENPDLILVLKKNGEDTLSAVVDHPEKRPLLILLRNANNELRLETKNDNTVYCIDCGGIMGDPYMGITIKDGYFSVEHYGGSAWRWTRIITYKYSKKDNQWYLHKDGSESFHATDPEKVESKVRTTKDFGKVKFEEFDIYKDE